MIAIESIAIENTTMCGADCIMCTRHDFKYQPDIMSWEVFVRSVEASIHAGVREISITGFGDPLMDRLFPDRLKYIKEKFPYVKISITSTCQLLGGTLADAVAEYVDVLLISMYGFSKKTYEAIHRGSLIFEKVKKNIDEFLCRRSRPYVVMKFLMMSENEHETKAWKQYYEPKANRLDIWLPHNFGGRREEYSKTLSFRGCFRIEKLNGLVVRTNGDVVMCCMDYNGILVLGNVMNEPLSDILEGDKVKYMQEINADGRIVEFSLCKNCDQLYDRSEALVYSSDPQMKVGKLSMKTG